MNHEAPPTSQAIPSHPTIDAALVGLLSRAQSPHTMVGDAVRFLRYHALAMGIAYGDLAADAALTWFEQAMGPKFAVADPVDAAEIALAAAWLRAWKVVESG